MSTVVGRCEHEPDPHIKRRVEVQLDRWAELVHGLAVEAHPQRNLVAPFLDSDTFRVNCHQAVRRRTAGPPAGRRCGTPYRWYVRRVQAAMQGGSSPRRAPPPPRLWSHHQGSAGSSARLCDRRSHWDRENRYRPRAKHRPTCASRGNETRRACTRCCIPPNGSCIGPSLHRSWRCLAPALRQRPTARRRFRWECRSYGWAGESRAAARPACVLRNQAAPTPGGDRNLLVLP